MKSHSKPTEIEGLATRKSPVPPGRGLFPNNADSDQHIWKSGGSSGHIEGDRNGTISEVASP